MIQTMADKNLETYTMHLEYADGIKDWPYHLGTDLKIAMKLAKDALGFADVKTVALRKNGKIVEILDDID